jgi:glycosyltransferase involved in cell wall biosynthesis
MAKRAKVLVVGGGNLERAPDGSAVTKVPIANYIHGLSDRLGHCVWLVEGSGTWGAPIGETTERIKGRLDPEKVTVIEIDGRVKHTLRSCRLFLRYAIQRPYGIFFLPAFMSMVPVFPFAKLFLKKNAVYLAGDYEITLADPNEGKWFGWKALYRLSYVSAMRICDLVIARGRHLGDLAKRENGYVIETVPLGHMLTPDPAQSRELADTDPRRILYMGLIIKPKGLGDLLRALAALQARRPQPGVILDVLGEGPDREELEALARELGIADAVHFRGWIEAAEEVRDYFSRCDAVVMPTSTHQEGVPRCIDEALVRRIPVVATRVAGVPKEFSDGEVLLVDPGKPEQLADGIEAILFDPEIRKTYIEGAERRRLHWGGLTSAAEQHAKILDGTITVPRS